MGRNNMLRHLVLNADHYPPKPRSDCAELSFFNVMTAATYFRRPPAHVIQMWCAILAGNT